MDSYNYAEIRNGRACTENDKRLYTELEPDEQYKLLKWINFYLTPGNQPLDYSSYNYKHRFEEETRIYVTNNQFKDAMLACGYYPEDEHDMNWTYRISKKSPLFTRKGGEYRKYDRIQAAIDPNLTFFEALQHLHISQDFNEVKAYYLLSREADNYLFDPEKLAAQCMADEQARETLFPMAVRWVFFWGTTKVKSLEDRRNEAAKQLCARYCLRTQITPDLEDILKPLRDKLDFFVDSSREDHKTVMQKETSFMLAFLNMYPHAELQKTNAYMRQEYGREWFRLPVIF